MTAPAFVFTALLVVGVFGLCWWLVELSGGVAGRAFSLGRSVGAGVLGWFDPDATDGPAPPEVNENGSPKAEGNGLNDVADVVEVDPVHPDLRRLH